MAEANKQKKFKTEYVKGIGKYPRLNEPDTKFNKAGVFSVKLIVPEDKATPLMEGINAAMDAAFAEKIEAMKKEGKSPALIKKVKKADPPYVEVYGEDEQPTGEYEFTFKMNHTFTKKDGSIEKRWPRMVDSKGNEIKGKKPSIWGGSVLTVAFQMKDFDSPVAGVGISLRLQGVQINKLVSGSGAALNFQEDGDYEADEGDEDAPQFPSTNSVDGSADADSDNPDF